MHRFELPKKISGSPDPRGRSYGLWIFGLTRASAETLDSVWRLTNWFYEVLDAFFGFYAIELTYKHAWGSREKP